MFDLRQKKNGRPLLVGHRGAMAVAPENTMVSFETAVSAGADIIELDVQLTADDQVIIFHDHNLQHKAGISGHIGQYSAEFLQTLDVGRHFDDAFAGTPMPLLDELLSWAKGRVPLMIELKHGPIFAEQLEAAVIHLIEDHRMVDEVVLISFDQFALLRAKQLNPHIATSYIYGGRLLNPLAQVRDLPVDALSPFTDYLTAAEVAQIQQAGYACSPGGFWWDYPTLLAWGVDTISSNDPGSFNAASFSNTPH